MYNYKNTSHSEYQRSGYNDIVIRSSPVRYTDYLFNDFNHDEPISERSKALPEYHLHRGWLCIYHFVQDGRAY